MTVFSGRQCFKYCVFSLLLLLSYPVRDVEPTCI